MFSDVKLDIQEAEAKLRSVQRCTFQLERQLIAARDIATRDELDSLVHELKANYQWFTEPVIAPDVGFSSSHFGGETRPPREGSDSASEARGVVIALRLDARSLTGF
ncbi:unnamed protein product [Echinostoma caproni]|uniref:Uncharacterized protein n=1 Tax=Echinostoma caproni TaxID=27848 RepID=A0A183BCT8_9TREM|nr:unnamed protein product [Echinostoma caproni]